MNEMLCLCRICVWVSSLCNRLTCPKVAKEFTFCIQVKVWMQKKENDPVLHITAQLQLYFTQQYLQYYIDIFFLSINTNMCEQI